MDTYNEVQLVTFGHKQRILSAQNTKYTGNVKMQFSRQAPIQIAWDQLLFSPINMNCMMLSTPKRVRFSFRQGWEWLPLNGNNMFAIQNAAAANVISCRQECDWNKNNP